MLKDLGIHGGTLIACLAMGYFVIKWAVKNAILEAHYEITGEKTEEELMVERMMEEDEKKRQIAKNER
ncbi:MAG: hypothetical protein IKZ90_02565 [Clostridiales bacterium]|nr:hypothetical protein [Clostridiales bacterium]